jgi:hypothetical protein
MPGTSEIVVMVALAFFGVFGVIAMLVSHRFERYSPWLVLGFAGVCSAGSAYGFLRGAWPFGIAEAIWAFMALNRWRGRVRC